MTQNSDTHKLDMTKTSKRDARIVELRQEGHTYQEIAEDIPCANQTVYKVLFVAGLTKKGRNASKLSDTDRQEIARLRTEDPQTWTYMALAVEFKCQPPTINKVLRAAGLTKTKKRA